MWPPIAVAGNEIRRIKFPVGEITALLYPAMINTRLEAEERGAGEIEGIKMWETNRRPGRIRP